MEITQKIRTGFVYAMGPFFKITVAVIIVVVLIIGYLTFINPKYQEVQGVGVLDLETKKMELAEKESELDQLKILEKEYRQINQAQIKEIEKILPSGSGFTDLVSQIEALATDSNLTLTSISVTEGGLLGQTDSSEISPGDSTDVATSGSNIYLLNVAVSFSGGGTYDHLKLFLENLENNMRLLDLSSLSFSPGTEGYTMNLKTYYLRK